MWNMEMNCVNGVISVTRGILAGNIKRQVNKDIFIYVATFVDIVWMISTSQHVRPFIYCERCNFRDERNIGGKH